MQCSSSVKPTLVLCKSKNVKTSSDKKEISKNKSSNASSFNMNPLTFLRPILLATSFLTVTSSIKPAFESFLNVGPTFELKYQYYIY